MSRESMEKLADIVDTLDNLHGALLLPMPAAVHVEQLKIRIPELRNKLRDIYMEETGEDPWLT